MKWSFKKRFIPFYLAMVATIVLLFSPYFLVSSPDWLQTISREAEAICLDASTQLMLLVCLTVWCITFLLLAFSIDDLLLIGLLLIAITAYFIGNATLPVSDALTLLVEVAVGKGTRLLLEWGEDGKCQTRNFLIGLVGLLLFSSWWHLNMSANLYHGPRWMGLWNNPNVYGMLMGAGVVLAVGLLAARQRIEGGGWQMANGKWQKGRAFTRRLLEAFLFIAAGMMGVGLVCSYSRGAWAGAAIGLLYLARAYRKFKWRWVAPVVVVVAAVVIVFWGRTPDSAPWYVKRLDFGRPSAQHRVAAWQGALHMMWDHPFGVGWNRAVEVYERDYSPPENGAGAITTNDYLMLGTQLGWPGLICFVTYVGLCLRGARDAERGVRSKSPPSAPVKQEEGGVPDTPTSPSLVTRHSSLGKEDSPSPVTCHSSPQTAYPGDPAPMSPVTCHLSPQTACRAGAVMMLVAFWFDGGLFTLATGSVFWVLLELGRER